MLARFGALVVVVVAVGGACGCGEPPCSENGPWAEVDLAPLHGECSADPSTCPAPYQCITYRYYVGLVVDPPVERTLCEVPCADDHDCPQGFFCQGRCTVGEAGLPDGYCLESI
jgi:hypothetical protein